MVLDISQSKGGYKSEKWKWVFQLKDKTNLISNSNLLLASLTDTNLLQAYGLNKTPKSLPCKKRCSNNPWCVTSILKETRFSATQLTEQLRDMSHPVGLQNTANTCWINSALQALFHIYQFRNGINSIEGFECEDNLSSLDYLLQAMFVEMELHKNKALACTSGSVFEKLAIFVTREIMQKDQDFEVLKCVSEFLENTIDNLLGNPRTNAQFSSIFRTTLYRVAKWNCTSCQRTHTRQLPPDTCYTMAAYVSGDECPLDQCILDLQTETQTGVSLVCGDGGCGATVKVDRIVTPQILNLPTLLIIRNNSLIDKEIKRRLHVVYPETLDLTPYTYNQEAAPYSLRAVIYHHGHWMKHFSAHVKTEDGKWYNYNDEKVNRLVSRPGNCPPLETHKNYFSFANVANKYRNRSNVRVSRGAFIWIYERESTIKEKILLEPPNSVVDYVLSKQNNKQNTDAFLIEVIKEDREKLFKKLIIENHKQEFCLISHPLLSAWFSSQDAKFVPQPSVLAQELCEHRKFDPLKHNSFNCIKKEEGHDLLNSDCGIHSEDKIPVIYSFEEAFCKECVVKHAHHILFRENLKELQKRVKKEAFKTKENDTTFIGTTTLGSWIKLALNIYMKEVGLDEEGCIEEEPETSPKSEMDANGHEKKESSNDLETMVENGKTKESPSASNENGKGNVEDNLSYFNEDIVCCHNMINPSVSGVWLHNSLTEELKKLCSTMLHPATQQVDFGPCPNCKNNLEKTLEICSIGKVERKELYQLFLERKRPHPVRDADKVLYFLSREFLSDWKSFVRMCLKEEHEVSRPESIKNSVFLCKHNQLMYPCVSGGAIFDYALLIFEEEWNLLKERYSFDHAIEVRYIQDGSLVPGIGVCEEGCVEEEAVRLYEEQFNFEYELINIRQVHSMLDVPSEITLNPEANPKKKPRMIARTETSDGYSSLRTASQRLVRASKTFSSSATIKEIQNFIAERTGIWPLLQTLWLGGGKEHGKEPFLLTDKHRSMTLKSLRIKPGDTIYFRATIEDMEKAAGDGETEYNEIEDDEQ